jgi:hypothetical protein
LTVGILGPSKDEIWRQLSDQIGGDFVQGGFWKGSKVQAPYKQWTITLDTSKVFTGHMIHSFTRMCTPYVSKDGFQFAIHRTAFIFELGKKLGMQDIEIGEPDFDKAFIIKGDDDIKLRAMFGNQKLRRLIEQLPRFHLTVKSNRLGTSLPEGVDELFFAVGGIVKDIELLISFFDLFAEILDHLCDIGSAYENDPGVVL